MDEIDEGQLFILPGMRERHAFFNYLNEGTLQLAIELSEQQQLYWLDVDLFALGGV